MTFERPLPIPSVISSSVHRAAAEPATYHRHTDLLPGGGLRRGLGLGCHSRSSHGAEEFSSIFHLRSHSFQKTSLSATCTIRGLLFLALVVQSAIERGALAL
jgi:hypothetical protein